MNIQTKPKIIAIVGPTASGKTDLSILLARKYGGEVISADSRQVYRGMDIGTGKITSREKRGVPHYLIDVASPKRTFTAAQYRAQGRRALARIIVRGKLPIICGGTGFYMDALLNDTPLPGIKPDPKLRKKLDTLSAHQLFAMLQKKDPRRAATIDRANKRRLVRALEIVATTGLPVPPRRASQNSYHVLFLGLLPDPATLRKKIRHRLMTRFRKGMIAEVRRLHEKEGVSWQRLDDLGLEYRYISRYLRGSLSKKEMIAELENATDHYAKRQITWFKRNPETHWVSDGRTADRLAEKFLKSKK